jgi:hypothetical protein
MLLLLFYFFLLIMSGWNVSRSYSWIGPTRVYFATVSSLDLLLGEVTPPPFQHHLNRIKSFRLGNGLGCKPVTFPWLTIVRPLQATYRGWRPIFSFPLQAPQCICALGAKAGLTLVPPLGIEPKLEAYKAFNTTRGF